MVLDCLPGWQQDWCEATTAKEAIRKATLLPPRKHVGWLDAAAAAAEQQIAAAPDKPRGEDSSTAAN